MVAVTGDLQTARGLFNQLNDVSREIPQSFDEITQSALILNKTGLKPTADNIKSLAAISIGTGQSITSVAQAFGNAAMGRLKSLQQLGITAVQEGDKLKLTYQGVTETIKADTQSLMGYMNSLAENKFGETIEYQMSGLTGATKLWGEAWGDLYRAIGESGIGDAIGDIMRTAVRAIDGVTAALNDPEISQAIGGFGRLFTGAFNTIIDGLEKLWTPFSNFFSSLSISADANCKGYIGYFEGWFDFVRLGLGDMVDWISRFFDYASATAQRFGSNLAQFVHGTTREVASKADIEVKMTSYLQDKDLGENSILLNRRTGKADISAIARLPADNEIRQEYERVKSAVWEANKGLEGQQKTLQEQFDAIWDQHKKGRNKKYDELADAHAKLLEKLGKGPNFDRIGNNPIGNGEGSSGGKGGGGSSRLEADRRAFDQLAQSLERARVQSLSALQQEEIEYQKHIATITDALNRRVVSEQEAKALLEQVEFQHQENLNKIRQDAEVKLAEMRGDPIAKLQMQYSQELEALEQLHADKLASEEVYLQSMTALYDRYYGEMSKKNEKDKKGKGKDGKKDASILGISTEALDSVGKSLDMVSGAFSQMTANMDESSGAYKTLFAVEKSFALATAMVNGMAAIGKGMATATTWYEWAAVYAQAIAMVGNIVSTISSVSMHDKGGSIPAGEYGIVGEIGPELVRGPASVTSRKDTADLLSQRGETSVVVNLIEDASRAGQVEKEDTDEATIIQVCVANIHRGGELADAISNTYGVARQGV
ncbi:MAG: hypothetical protein IJ523_12360 [Succinivibrionaceae bacterium]|nr:hypothetical protein [Succinivibrionaceae bacterium]